MQMLHPESSQCAEKTNRTASIYCCHHATWCHFTRMFIIFSLHYTVRPTKAETGFIFSPSKQDLPQERPSYVRLLKGEKWYFEDMKRMKWEPKGEMPFSVQDVKGGELVIKVSSRRWGWQQGAHMRREAGGCPNKQLRAQSGCKVSEVEAKWTELGIPRFHWHLGSLEEWQELELDREGGLKEKSSYAQVRSLHLFCNQRNYW